MQVLFTISKVIILMKTYLFFTHDQVANPILLVLNIYYSNNFKFGIAKIINFSPALIKSMHACMVTIAKDFAIKLIASLFYQLQIREVVLLVM